MMKGVRTFRAVGLGPLGRGGQVFRATVLFR